MFVDSMIEEDKKKHTHTENVSGANGMGESISERGW
jgi:hypothetical protein